MQVKLEQLAKRAFDEFAKKNNTRSANWSLLNRERQVVWMQEVIVMFRVGVEYLTEQIKPVAPPKIGMASYERGYNEGTRQERLALATFLASLMQELEQQLDDFTNREIKKDN